MDINNFEEYFDPVILERGKDYYYKNKVDHIIQDSNGEYKAVISGSDVYSVTARLNSELEIDELTCDCPYDWTDHCKHKAAILYKIRDLLGRNEAFIQKENPNDAPPNNGLQGILSTLDKDELIKIISDLSDQYPEIEKEIQFRYSVDENEISQCKTLVTECINKEKYKGFISWSKVGPAVKGAELALERAVQRLEGGFYSQAIGISLVVMPPVVKMIDFSDDSGYISPILNEATEIIIESAHKASELESEQRQEELFNEIIKEAKNRRYDGWSEWRHELLKAGAAFCGNKKVRNRLDKVIEQLLGKETPVNWNSSYEIEALKVLQFMLIERFDPAEMAQAFLESNIQFKTFREKAILRALEKEDFTKALQLCEDGIVLNSRLPGLVDMWKRYRYKTYEQMGDIDNQKVLARELLMNNNLDFYPIHKGLFPPAEWEREKESFLNELESKDFSSVYRHIIESESETSRILRYCQNHRIEIMNLYEHIIEHYPREVSELFRSYIEYLSKEAGDRRKYKGVCKVIRTYKKACGSESAKLLIDHLKSQYQRRPAFIEELNKIN
ncbi:SWIM zinc finger domain-containing protein [Neobacillus sp. SCS-31]|uniref:SWIM zinc finger family protein n=1 Tax=Neobacillus oceani TaxID=3115292 RepID=UPI003906BC19